jgi:hypothetical protein
MSEILCVLSERTSSNLSGITVTFSHKIVYYFLPYSPVCGLQCKITSNNTNTHYMPFINGTLCTCVYVV